MLNNSRSDACSICHSFGVRWVTLLFFLAGTLFLVGLTACEKESNNATRWYSQQQVTVGAKVFANQCASCHGGRAEGVVDSWKVRLEDGSYPAPPLNGSAHAWHHSLPLLLQIVQQGGARFDGKMPGFGNKLNEAEQYAVIAWFQSLWGDETYQLWQEGNNATQIIGGNSGD